MDLPLFLCDGFRFVFAYKKRELSFSQKFSYNILNFHMTYSSLVHNYTPDWLNAIPRKYLENDKLFDLGI